MNVAHLSSAITWRGGEQQIVYLFEELQLRGIEQIILCPDGSALESYCIQRGWNCATATKNGSFSYPFARLIAKIARNNQVDILHIHDSHAHNNALLASRVFRLKIPMVLTRRVIFPVKNNPFSYWKYNYAGIKNIICVSNAVREVLGQTVQDTNKMEVIYESVDTTQKPVSKGVLRNEYNIPAEAKLIGNIASLTPEKDHMTLLRTVNQLKESIDARYIIIGDGGEKEKIKSAIQEMGLADQVILAGFRSHAKQLLAELDLLLITSVAEGLCTTILDAYVAGVPAVATAVGGIPEILLDEVTGLLAPAKDDALLARQVLRLLGDKILRDKMVKGGAALVQKHSKTVMAEQTLGIYKTILT